MSVLLMKNYDDDDDENNLIDVADVVNAPSVNAFKNRLES